MEEVLFPAVSHQLHVLYSQLLQTCPAITGQCLAQIICHTFLEQVLLEQALGAEAAAPFALLSPLAPHLFPFQSSQLPLLPDSRSPEYSPTGPHLGIALARSSQSKPKWKQETHEQLSCVGDQCMCAQAHFLSPFSVANPPGLWFCLVSQCRALQRLHSWEPGSWKPLTVLASASISISMADSLEMVSLCLAYTWGKCLSRVCLQPSGAETRSECGSSCPEQIVWGKQITEIKEDTCPPKPLHHSPSSAGQGRENIMKGSWDKVRTGGDHSPI